MLSNANQCLAMLCSIDLQYIQDFYPMHSCEIVHGDDAVAAALPRSNGSESRQDLKKNPPSDLGRNCIMTLDYAKWASHIGKKIATLVYQRAVQIRLVCIFWTIFLQMQSFKVTSCKWWPHKWQILQTDT